MKTGRLTRIKLWLIAAFVLAAQMPMPGWASLNLSMDGDARYRWAEGEGARAYLHLVGASVRKVFSDDRGDRFTLFGLVEAEDNLSEVMLHEVYGQYKGPLGAWNITVGRFGVPWGLLPGFSATRLLYDMPHDALLGMDVDSGIKVSGVVGAFDYALSLTQGYGPHHTPRDMGHGLGVARLGFTPGDTEEFSLGVSAAWGESVTAHGHGARMVTDGDEAVQRALAGLDATLYWGRWLGRMELSTGRVDHRAITTLFTAVDYALLPRLDLNLAVNAQWHGSAYHDTLFAGFTGKLKWFNIRGGYRYAGHDETRHEVMLQLYRLFSFSF